MRRRWLTGSALTCLVMLTACGGGGGAVNSTPPPPVVTPPPPPPAPPPPPPPPPPVIPPPGSFDTAEYRGSSALVQAQAIAAYDAGANAGGVGVIAAVVDSGVEPANPEFAGRIHPNSRDISGSRGLGDQGNHGSQVAGVLLGARNGSASHGVAFNATLLALRTDSEGSCEAPNPTVQGGCFHAFINIARAIDVARTTGARVINLSIVGDAPSSELVGAIDRATAAGIVIVISAGNGRTLDPAAFAQVANRAEARGLVIVAGALDATNANLTNFSARAGNSASQFLSALGLSVRTVNAVGAPSVVSGTSFSAPVIAGAVALLAQTFPNLTGRQIVDILFRTANDLGAAGVDATFGNGAINLARAFAPQGPVMLAGLGLPVTPGASLGTASTVIGDGGRGAGTAIVLDDYGRAFTTNIDRPVAAATPTRVLGALANPSTLALGATVGPAQLAFTILPSRHGAASQLLSLTHEDHAVARLIAGSAIAQLDRRTAAAAGYGIAASQLAGAMTGTASEAFLAASSAGTGLRRYQQPGAAIAIAHQIGNNWLTFSADHGTIVRDVRDARDRLGESRRDDRYDQLAIGLNHAWRSLSLAGQLSHLIERDTVLGARFSPLLGNGARSWFADLSARLAIDRRWHAGASWRTGWTRAGGSALRSDAERLRTSAWAFDLGAGSLFSAGDALSLRIAQPLRVVRGGLSLTLPTAYDYATSTATLSRVRLDLAPEGREIDIEATYGFVLGPANIGTNLFWRREPGNLAGAPDDRGGSVRIRFDF